MQEICKVYEKLSTIVFSPISLIPPTASNPTPVSPEDEKVQSLSSKRRLPNASKAKPRVVDKEETPSVKKRVFNDEETDGTKESRKKKRKP